MRIASIDIGTNTIRMLVCEVSGRDIRKLYKGRVITRLGGGFTTERRLLTEKAIERSVGALREFSEIIKDAQVEKVRAVATSVVRESLNRSDFITRVKQETGINVEVISGHDEAKLAATGVLNSVPVNTKYAIILDIGGGSTEYVFLENGSLRDSLSTDLGVVHLSDRFMDTDIPTTHDIKHLSDHVESAIKSELQNRKMVSTDSLSLIATAGTPTTLAAIEIGMDEYDAELVNGFVLSMEMILKIFNKLRGMPSVERLKVKGLEKGREDVIIPGIIILLKFMERFSQNRVTVSEGGLLEGVAISMVESPLAQIL